MLSLIINSLMSFIIIIELDVRDDFCLQKFLIQGCLGYPGFFVFPYEVEDCSFKVCEELFWDVNGDYTDSKDCFW